MSFRRVWTINAWFHLEEFGDIQRFPTLYGNLNHADVLHGICSVQTKPAICLFLPVTYLVHLVVDVVPHLLRQSFALTLASWFTLNLLSWGSKLVRVRALPVHTLNGGVLSGMGWSRIIGNLGVFIGDNGLGLAMETNDLFEVQLSNGPASPVLLHGIK